MTFDLITSSEYQGEPVELFEFNRGLEFWRFNTTDSEITVGGQIYEAAPIDRPKLEETQDIDRSSIKIRCSRNLSLVTQFISSPPADQINVTIKAYQAQDVDNEVIIIWIGRVINVEFDSKDQALISCEPLISSLNRPGLRRAYQTNCPHVLYGPSCALDRVNFEINATLISVNGTAIQSGTFALEADGYYDGGYVEYTNPRSSIDKRLILTHVGDTLTLGRPIDGLPSNASVVVYPGCDRTLGVCTSKFSNTANYGGQPYFPDKNPFTSPAPVV